MSPNATVNYLKTFFAEKNLPVVNWELTDNTGMVHMISSDVVIEFLIENPDMGAQAVPTIRKIDFLNGDVNDFLKHIAGFIVNQ